MPKSNTELYWHRIIHKLCTRCGAALYRYNSKNPFATRPKHSSCTNCREKDRARKAQSKLKKEDF